MHFLGVEGVGFYVEGLEDGDDAANCVDRVYKDERAAGIAEEEVVEEQVLLSDGPRWLFFVIPFRDYRIR